MFLSGRSRDLVIKLIWVSASESVHFDWFGCYTQMDFNKGLQVQLEAEKYLYPSLCPLIEDFLPVFFLPMLIQC